MGIDPKIRLNHTENSFKSNLFESKTLVPIIYQNPLKNTFTGHCEGKNKKNQPSPHLTVDRFLSKEAEAKSPVGLRSYSN